MRDCNCYSCQAEKAILRVAPNDSKKVTWPKKIRWGGSEKK